MENFTDVSGEVILKKYSPVGEMSTLAQAYAGVLVSLTGQAAAVCDTEQIIAVAGPAKKEPLHKPLSPQLDELVQGKRPFTTPGQDTVPVAQGVAAEALAVFPLVAEGDPMGAVLLLKGERSPKQLDAGTLESPFSRQGAARRRSPPDCASTPRVLSGGVEPQASRGARLKAA